MPEHTPAPTSSRAVYGFVMYLSFQIFFIVYIVWALVPEEYFKLIGITFLPQRYWAITVPVFFLTILTVFAFVVYPSLGLCMTPNMDDLRTIKDKIGTEREENGKHLMGNFENLGNCICNDRNKCYKEYYESIKCTTVNKMIPKLKDLDIWDVSDRLYSK